MSLSGRATFERRGLTVTTLLQAAALLDSKKPPDLAESVIAIRKFIEFAEAKKLFHCAAPL